MATFQDLITFTRASEGTYFDSSGVLRKAAIDAPRFDYHPTTGEALGLLIEEQRTNLLLRSEAFENTAWVKFNITVLVDSGVAPDGATTADKLQESTNDSEKYVEQAITPEAATFVATFFVKAAGRTKGLIRPVHIGEAEGGSSSAAFDLAAGTIGAGTGRIIATDMKALPNGWFRISATFSTTTAATTVASRLQIQNDAGASSYIGDGASGFFAWAGDLQKGPFPTSYIPTTSAQVTRAADVASVDNLAPWFNTGEGAVYVEFVVGETQTISTAFELKGPDRLQVRLTSGKVQLVSITGTTVNSPTLPTLFALGDVVRVAVSFDRNTGVLLLETSARDSFTHTGYDSQYSKLWLGQGDNSVESGDISIKDLRFYPRALTAAELAELTA